MRSALHYLLSPVVLRRSQRPAGNAEGEYRPDQGTLSRAPARAATRQRRRRLAVTTVEPPGADEPLDELDFRLLAGVRELWEDADPMPATLVDQIRFAIRLEDVDLEVMRIREQDRFAGARS